MRQAPCAAHRDAHGLDGETRDRVPVLLAGLGPGDGDNAEDLLAELTLEYNKGRQQKITNEILDLIGGSQQ